MKQALSFLPGLGFALFSALVSRLDPPSGVVLALWIVTGLCFIAPLVFYRPVSERLIRVLSRGSGVKPPLLVADEADRTEPPARLDPVHARELRIALRLVIDELTDARHNARLAADHGINWGGKTPVDTQWERFRTTLASDGSLSDAYDATRQAYREIQFFRGLQGPLDKQADPAIKRSTRRALGNKVMKVIDRALELLRADLDRF